MAKSAVLHRWMVVGKQYGAQSTPRHFGPQSLVSFVIWHMCDTRPHLAASTVESWSKKLSPNLFGLASVHSRPCFVENYQNDVLQFDFVLIFNAFLKFAFWLAEKIRAKTAKLSFFAACKQTKTFEKATAAFFCAPKSQKRENWYCKEMPQSLCQWIYGRAQRRHIFPSRSTAFYHINARIISQHGNSSFKSSTDF